MNIYSVTDIIDLRDSVEFFRLDANRKLDPSKRSKLGQFMTPPPVAGFMASLFKQTPQNMSLLDPGAGVGSLTAAFVQKILEDKDRPKHLKLTAFEIEPVMQSYLQESFRSFEITSKQNGIGLTGKIRPVDFIEWGVSSINKSDDLSADDTMEDFSHCIINPPYKKIRNDSTHRTLLREVGMETSNLYTAFMTIAIKLLADGGELVAIVPRSFCNGVYFRPFREFLLQQMSIEHLHVFDSRKSTFKDDDVLQENIIFHAVKGKKQGKVTITSCSDISFGDMTEREVTFDKVVNPNNLDQVIHIATSDRDQFIVDGMAAMDCTMKEAGLEVCTGPVVDFRLRDDIQQQHSDGLCPLIYPGHFEDHEIAWPKPEGKKPNAIACSDTSERWLMNNGCYVLTKRFSAKEEKRRVVAALHTPKKVPGNKIGFENHVNVFHQHKQGLDPDVAKGLTVYLNSSLVDLYFRLFSGHTQVNASDLRMLRYPNFATLKRLGILAGDRSLGQNDIDDLLNKTVFMNTKNEGGILDGQQKIDEALSILKELGMPRAQINDRSALTLLSLLDLKPDESWGEAKAPLIGITPIITFCKDQYGKAYAPNTRETFRRQTMHQFMEAGLALANPDKLDRAVNSPKSVYQIEPHALELIMEFGSKAWKTKLKAYLKTRKTLAARYAKERDMQRIPLIINGGKKLALTPGIHSQLIKDIIEQFGQRYAPGSQVLYVGDTGSKLGHFDEEVFKMLGLTFDNHGKFPDVVLYFKKKNWLLLIESVTSHGPVDAKRHGELSKLFAASKAGLVYVTAFPDRSTMAKYLPAIGWETEVWVADAPTHLIHFNGERFLGPYE